MRGLKLIPLDERGSVAIINESDYEKVSAYKWHKSDTGYAVWRGVVNGVKRTVRMHRLITNAPEGLVVDHLNNDPLDNRASNLRICTQAENSRNRKETKGYCWDNEKSKWLVTYRGKFYGRYKTEDEAKRAYQLACSGVPSKKREHRQKYHLPTGVFKNRSNKGYQARIQINGKRIYLGTFTTIEEARNAYLNRKRG